MLVNRKVYSYTRMRAPAPELGKVSNYSWSANGQLFGEVVVVAGTRTILALR